MRSADDRDFMDLVRSAANRYRGTSITARQFARGKLWGDPVYRRALCHEGLPSGGTLLDLGCGQGLSLALFAEARRKFEAGAWPAGWPPPPRFERMIGLETRRRVARLARTALGPDAEIVDADARTAPIGQAHVVLLFDVLQMMPRPDQEALLVRVAATLVPAGVMLVREADASGGRRFAAVRLGNRAKALALGSWRQPFHFRTEADWIACFVRLGFHAISRPPEAGEPFANVLFHLTPAAAQTGVAGARGKS
jgi:SAM-dependent methyltransferase